MQSSSVQNRCNDEYATTIVAEAISLFNKLSDKYYFVFLDNYDENSIWDYIIYYSNCANVWTLLPDNKIFQSSMLSALQKHSKKVRIATWDIGEWNLKDRIKEATKKGTLIWTNYDG